MDEVFIHSRFSLILTRINIFLTASVPLEKQEKPENKKT